MAQTTTYQNTQYLILGNSQTSYAVYTLAGQEVPDPLRSSIINQLEGVKN